MAVKKDRSLSTRKEAIGKRPWPNLPQRLLASIARKPNLLQQMSFPGTTKSWTTSTTRTCNNTRQHPQLPQLHDLEGRKCHSSTKKLPQFIDIYFRTEAYQWWYYYHRQSPPHFWDINPCFVGYSCGKLITGRPGLSGIQIFNLSTRLHWLLPPWDVNFSFKFASLSSSSESANLMVVLTGISSPAFVVYNQNEQAWIRHECTTVDPYDAKKQFMRFTNIIGFERKFYALSLQGALAVIEEIDSRLQITNVGRSRAVPSVSARYFKEYLLESDGEILMVFLIHRRTLSVVDQVEVFRLNFDTLSWIKVESLQERVLFLETECCIWVNSSQVGCRGNCVYLSQNADDGWFIYDMETGFISPGFAATSLPWNEPVLEE